MKIYYILKLIFISLWLLLASANAKLTLNIQGSSTVNPIVVEAAEIFTKEEGWQIFVDTQGGSSGGIASVAEGLADIGMSSKPIDIIDKRKFPQADFRSIVIGIDGVSLVVSKPVWEGGIKYLTRNQVKKLYERRVRNWHQVNGPKAPIVFYNKEPGRGTWSIFANWVYGSYKNAPPISHPEVGSNEETRNKVTHHPSAISQLSFAWAEKSKEIYALGLKTDNGKIVYSNIESIRSGSYPMTRRLFLITNGEPTSQVKGFIDFMLSQKGQKLVVKHGYIPIKTN